MNTIDGLLESYAAAWRSNRSERIADHWESDHFLLYKAEEVECFFHAWEEVLAYWRGNEALHESIRLRFGQAVVRPLAEDLVLALTPMRWDIRFAEDARTPDGAAFPHRGRAMGGSNHVLAFVHNPAEMPRLRGWCETPNAAITVMRALYSEYADESVL